jgi:hypothetical protein
VTAAGLTVGRSTSTTSTSARRSRRASPAPYEPVPSTPTRTTGPNDCSQPNSLSLPARDASKLSTPNNPPISSNAAATCTSRWVSTPPVTAPTSVFTMVIAIPFSRFRVKGWHAPPSGCGVGVIALLAQSDPPHPNDRRMPRCCILGSGRQIVFQDSRPTSADYRVRPEPRPPDHTAGPPATGRPSASSGTSNTPCRVCIVKLWPAATIRSIRRCGERPRAGDRGRGSSALSRRFGHCPPSVQCAVSWCVADLRLHLLTNLSAPQPVCVGVSALSPCRSGRFAESRKGSRVTSFALRGVPRSCGTRVSGGCSIGAWGRAESLMETVGEVELTGESDLRSDCLDRQ